MTNLPARFVEADALTYARGRVAAIRDGKVALRGTEHGHWFETDESRSISRHEFKRWAMANTANMMTAVQAARAGYGFAYDALIELILECRDRNVSIPSVSIYLAAFDMDVTAGMKFRRKSGRCRSDYIMRDITLCFVVFYVSKQFGLKPTRNAAARRRPSAGSIVTEALRLEGVLFNLTEATINQIWKNHHAAIIAEDAKV